MQLSLEVFKYAAPQLPPIVHRERLLRRLNACRPNGIILLLGQAAQGKTTLAADYLKRKSAPTAWLGLDVEDSEVGAFYSLLLRSLTCVSPGERLDADFKAGARSGGGRKSVESYIKSLRKLWRRLPNRVEIVLDGLDRLSAEAPAYRLIQKMCTETATKGRLWLLSRSNPPFKFQKALINQKIMVLTDEEMAFNCDEIGLYFQQLHSLELSADCKARIQHITDGWSGGLVLLSQAMDRDPDAYKSDFFARSLEARLLWPAMQYFSEEIFNTLPEKTKRFLTSAAMLDEIDPLFLSVLLGVPDCEMLLENLVQSNLFIHADYDHAHQRPLYRFNYLFREFLRAKFSSARDEEAQRLFYAQVGRMYDDQGDVGTAVQWYLKAADYDLATSGLKKIGIDLTIRGKTEELSQRIAGLPEERVRSDPWLLFLMTLTRRIKGGLRSLEDFENVLAQFVAKDDVRGQMLALAYLIESNILLGRSPADCLHWIRQAEEWLARQGANPYFAYAKALLWLQIAFGFIACGIDLTKGLSAGQNAQLLARKMGNTSLLARATIITVLGLATAGDVERADETLARIKTDIEGGPYAEYDVLRRLVHAEVSLRRGDLAAADHKLTAIGEDIETYGLLFLYPAYVDAKGFLQLYQGQFAQARATCRHLLDVATLSANAVYKALAHRLSGLIHYYQAGYAQAAAETMQAINILKHSGPATMHLMRAKQLLALTEVHLGHHDGAQALLAKTLDYFRQTGNYLSLAETYLIQGFLAHARKQESLARNYLHRGFDIVYQRRLDHFVILSPADLVHICQLALEIQVPIPPHWPVQRIHAEQTAADNPAIPLISPRIRIKREKGVLDIRTFGGFSVLRDGTTPIESTHWGGNRPKLLLKAILVHGLREIPKDILIDDLWPESSPRAGAQNFKATLHRLRKILEPDLGKASGSAYIHLKDHLVSLDKERCRVDLEDFLQCSKDIRRHALSGETDHILALGRQVMALYSGDFLPEEPYAPWIEMKRWALRDAYIEIVTQMADIYQQQGEIDNAVECCRSAIVIDPCSEKAVRLLMQLYAAKGRRNEALHLYDQFCHAMQTDLGIEPDPDTTALFIQIRNNSNLHLKES